MGPKCFRHEESIPGEQNLPGQSSTGAGNRTADLIVSSFKKRSPLVIFECKFTGDVNDYRKGMAPACFTWIGITR